MIDVVHPRALAHAGELASFVRAVGASNVHVSGLHPVGAAQRDRLLAAMRPTRLLGEHDRCTITFAADASAIDVLRPLADGSCVSFLLECGDVQLRAWPREAHVRAPGLDLQTPDHARAFATFRARRATSALRGSIARPDDVGLARLPEALHALGGDVLADLTVTPDDLIALVTELTRSTLTLRVGEHTIAWPSGAISTEILVNADFETAKAAWLARVDAALAGAS